HLPDSQVTVATRVTITTPARPRKPRVPSHGHDLRESGHSLAPAAQREARRVQQGAHGLGIRDLAGADPGQGVREREDDGLEELVLVEGGGARGEVEGEEEMDALVAEAGRGVDGGEGDEAAGDEARLLLELAAGADLPVLAGAVGPTGGELEQLAAGGVAVRAAARDAGVGRRGVGEDGQRGGGAGVADELELAGGAVGEADRVEGEVDDAAAIDGAPGDEPGRERGRGVPVHCPVRVSGPDCACGVLRATKTPAACSAASPRTGGPVTRRDGPRPARRRARAAAR